MEGRGLLAPETGSSALPGSDDEALRLEVRAWLAAHPHPSGRALAEAGLVAPHLPAPWGRDASPVQQVVIDDELRAAGVRRPVNPIGIGWAGPTLVAAGTPQQQRRWMPGLLSGEEFWCQLFSEPEAGSDLASLRTRAVRDGDEWVITGSKIWTSYAHIATWGILLARTGEFERPQQGISYFVCRMDRPGVTIRPIVDMTGDHAFNEVFLDEVRLPADALIGVEHDGWRLAKVTLGNERVSLSGEGALWGRGPAMGDLLDLARRSPGYGPLLRDQLVQGFLHGELLRLLRLRLVAAQLAGRAPGPEASVRKALADDHGQEVMALGLALAGPAAMVADGGPSGATLAERREWRHGFLYSQALTIGGGTSVVQRNIIAERVLGLPADSGPASAGG